MGCFSNQVLFGQRCHWHEERHLTHWPMAGAIPSPRVKLSNVRPFTQATTAAPSLSPLQGPSFCGSSHETGHFLLRDLLLCATCHGLWSLLLSGQLLGQCPTQPTRTWYQLPEGWNPASLFCLHSHPTKTTPLPFRQLQLTAQPQGAARSLIFLIKVPSQL